MTSQPNFETCGEIGGTTENTQPALPMNGVLRLVDTDPEIATSHEHGQLSTVEVEALRLRHELLGSLITQYEGHIHSFAGKYTGYDVEDTYDMQQHLRLSLVREGLDTDGLPKKSYQIVQLLQSRAIDYARTQGPMTRRIYNKIKAADGDEAELRELRTEGVFEISIRSLNSSVVESDGRIELVDMLADSSAERPHEDFESALDFDKLDEIARQTLPEKHYHILMLCNFPRRYGFDSLTLKEVGLMCGVTESRICQITRDARNSIYTAATSGKTPELHPKSMNARLLAEEDMNIQHPSPQSLEVDQARKTIDIIYARYEGAVSQNTVKAIADRLGFDVEGDFSKAEFISKINDEITELTNIKISMHKRADRQDQKRIDNFSNLQFEDDADLELVIFGYLCASNLRAKLDTLQPSPKDIEKFDLLSGAEKKVLALIHLPGFEIAQILGIKESTARSHWNNINHKTGLNKLGQIGLAARALGVANNVDVNPAAGEELSPRQKQALHLVVREHTYEEISNRLAVDTSTTRTHLHNAYKILGAKGKYDAALHMVKLSMINSDLLGVKIN